MGAIQTVTMSEVEARACVTAIISGMGDLRELVFELHHRRGWQTLGYKTFGACIKGELDVHRATVYRQLATAREERGLARLRPAKPKLLSHNATFGGATKGATTGGGANGKARPPAPPAMASKDGRGKPIADATTAAVFARSQVLLDIAAEIEVVRQRVGKLHGNPVAAFLGLQQLEADLHNAKHALSAARPYAPCPYMPNCIRGCKTCRGSRWVPRTIWEQVPKEDRE